MDLVAETSALSGGDKGLRQTVDALHSALLRYLPMPTQHQILERWIDRGTRGAMARWLKAARDMPTLFDASVALAYWRATRDYRAAKSLAYQAEPDALGPIVSELVAQCEKGWIISKAILRSGCDDESIWDLVRSNHPSTYLYLCAQLRREISDDDAFALVWGCPGIAIPGDRGLAIWAVGQMGKVAVLDRIRDSAEVLFEKGRRGHAGALPGIASGGRDRSVETVRDRGQRLIASNFYEEPAGRRAVRGLGARARMTCEIVARNPANESMLGSTS